MNIRTYLIGKEEDILDTKNNNEQLSHSGKVVMQGLIYKKYAIKLIERIEFHYKRYNKFSLLFLSK